MSRRAVNPVGTFRSVWTRLARFIDSSPPDARAALQGYFASRSRVSRRTSTADRLPYWILLPCWTFDAWARGALRDRRTLNAILYAQYCLFLFVRIHDDLLDGQAHEPALIFAADAVLLESQRTFAQQIDTSEFRDAFRESLARTIRAIGDADHCQRRPGAMRRSTLPLYASVSAIFTVGATAVSLLSGRRAAV